MRMFSLVIWCAAKKGWELSTTQPNSGGGVLCLRKAVIVLFNKQRTERSFGYHSVVSTSPAPLFIRSYCCLHNATELPSGGQPVCRDLGVYSNPNMQDGRPGAPGGRIGRIYSGSKGRKVKGFGHPGRGSRTEAGRGKGWSCGTRLTSYVPRICYCQECTCGHSHRDTGCPPSSLW